MNNSFPLSEAFSNDLDIRMYAAQLCRVLQRKALRAEGIARLNLLSDARIARRIADDVAKDIL